MKALLILFALLMAYGCHTNPVGPDLSSPQDTPISSKNSNVISKDSTKSLTTKPDTTPLPPEHYTRKGPEIGFDLCDSERVGKLYLGMPGGQLVMIIGIPNKKSDTIRTGADGLIHQDWIYKKEGIWLDMAGEDMGTLKIAGLTIYAPCTFKTKRRIGIGSTISDIHKAYPKAMKISSETSARMIVIGSYYGGIMLTIDNNKVDTLFIGASAE